MSKSLAVKKHNQHTEQLRTTSKSLFLPEKISSANSSSSSCWNTNQNRAGDNNGKNKSKSKSSKHSDNLEETINQGK
jgi:hypothetical protein